MILPKLAISNLATRKVRLALTVAAIALSISLVIAVTSGYASFEATVRHYIAQFVGATDIEFMPPASDASIDEAAVKIIREDPRVETAAGRLEVESALLDSNGWR